MPSPRKPHRCFPHAFCLAAVASFCLMANGAFAAAAASVDQGGDYAGLMLDKIIELWTPPQGLKKDARVRLSVSVDARGQITACKILATSGVPAFDASTCDAASRSGPFGTPPYGAPMDVHMTFWNGTPKGKPNLTDKENTLQTGVNANGGPQTAPGQTPPLQQTQPAAQETSAPSRAATDKAAPGAAKAAQAPASQAAAAAGHTASETAADKTIAQYRKTVTRQLREATLIPAATAPGEYHTRIALTISPQGEITDFKVLAPTGDKLLDKYVQRGIRRAGSLPHPPADLKGRLDITLTLVRR